MAYVAQLLLICCMTATVLLHVVDARKILLGEIQTLTLRQGEMTTGRRSSPVPQLKCVGGSAGCSAFIPQHVQCYNRGSDGYDIQWECKTDMGNDYRFGKIDVSCEGYDYADDPFILAGSCGLEYKIDSVSSNTKSSGYNSYSSSKTGYNNDQMGFGSIFGFICVIMIIFFVYRTFFANDGVSSGGTYPNMASAPPPPPYSERDQGNYAGQSQGAPPPYGFRPEYQQQKQYPSAGQQQYGANSNSGQPGFLSGMMAGGLMGYLFGNNRSGYSGYNNSYNSHGYQRDWFGSPMAPGSRGSSPFGGGASSSGSRTSSGFGGTKRR